MTPATGLVVAATGVSEGDRRLRLVSIFHRGRQGCSVAASLGNLLRTGPRALTERVVHHATVVTLKGKSY